MTWSVSLIGRPDGICAELDRYAETLEPQSRLEFDGARNSLKTLVKENYDKTKAVQPLVQLDASGGGGVSTARILNVTIRALSAKLV